MKKLNRKGFTLIELLAVIVIMGILMLVAIPAMQRYIDNSKKDTYINTIKSYVEAVNTAYAGNELDCSNKDGNYYVTFAKAKEFLQNGGESPYSNTAFSGNILIQASNGKVKYRVSVTDGDNHGINQISTTDEIKDIDRTSITNITGGNLTTGGYTLCQ